MITHKDMNIRTSGAADDFRNRLVFKACCCERREREREREQLTSRSSFQLHIKNKIKKCQCYHSNIIVTQCTLLQVLLL